MSWKVTNPKTVQREVQNKVLTLSGDCAGKSKLRGTMRGRQNEQTMRDLIERNRTK